MRYVGLVSSLLTVVALLSVSWPVATTNAAPPVSFQEDLADSARCDFPSAANSIRVFETNTAYHLFREGGVTALKSGWIVAGVEVDARADLPGEVVPFRKTRIYQQEVGEVELPPRPEGVQITAPIPVPLSEDRWGLVWAEARPPEGLEERWDPNFYTQLWFSERRADGWSEPTLLLRSVTPIRGRWSGVRSIKYVPDRGAFIAVAEFIPGPGPRIVFGSVTGELREVPLPAGLFPKTVVLQRDESGRLVMVADVSRGIGRDAPSELIMLRSDDGGQEWSAPESIWNIESSSGVRELRLVIDSAGTKHVLWGMGLVDESIRHIWRSKSDESWRSTTIPAPDGHLVDWTTGIDRCGQLRMIRTVIVPPDGPYFQSATWNGAWSRFRRALEDFDGAHLFDGHTHDGRWYLGWSGWPGQVSQETPVDSITKLWISPH